MPEISIHLSDFQIIVLRRMLFPPSGLTPEQERVHHTAMALMDGFTHVLFMSAIRGLEAVSFAVTEYPKAQPVYYGATDAGRDWLEAFYARPGQVLDAYKQWQQIRKLLDRLTGPGLFFLDQEVAEEWGRQFTTYLIRFTQEARAAAEQWFMSGVAPGPDIEPPAPL